MSLLKKKYYKALAFKIHTEDAWGLLVSTTKGQEYQHEKQENEILYSDFTQVGT